MPLLTLAVAVLDASFSPQLVGRAHLGGPLVALLQQLLKKESREHFDISNAAWQASQKK